MRAYCLKQNHPKSLDQNLTPKNRTPNFQAIKISRGTKHPGYEGTITNLQIVLNTQKNRCVNQATQKNTCQNFPEQKLPKSKISHAKNSFDHSCRLKYGVNPSPPPWDWWRDITQIRAVPLSGRTAWEIASTNQKLYLDLGSYTSSVWNFYARFSDVISQRNQWWPHKMSAVFSGKKNNNRNQFFCFQLLKKRFQTQFTGWLTFLKVLLVPQITLPLQLVIPYYWYLKKHFPLC